MPPRARRSSTAPLPQAAAPKPRPARVPVRPAIVAAAQTITGQKIKRPELGKADREWQAEVWKMYDAVGELHFGLRWKAQACSRLRLVAAHSGDEPEPINLKDNEEDSASDIKAVQVAQQFAGSADQRSKVLRAGALNIDAIGEAVLVVYAETGKVRVFAPSDIKVQQGVWVAGGEELSEDDLVLYPRVPHPSDCKRVDSSVRSALPVLRTMHGLNQQLLGAIDSRLAGAGLLVVPQSISPPKKPPTEEDDSTTPESDAEQDPFLVALIEAMMTPIADRESAAAVVPLVVRVPDEAAAKIQHIVFAQQFDPELRAIYADQTRLLALDLDMPPEILLGTGDVNHWGQWAIDENAIKFHVVPTAQVLVDVIVDEWYRPALEQAGIDDPSVYTLYIDASELEQRADKSGKALELFDRAEISAQALRRESDFGDDDAPTEAERQRIISTKQALAGQGEAPAPGEAPVDETRAIPTLPEAVPADDTATAPATTPAGAAAVVLPPELRMHSLMDAAHVAVLRALELAGKRHIAQDRSLRNVAVPPARVHTQYKLDAGKLDFYLKGSWDALATVVSPCLVHEIDTYTRELLVNGVEHSREYLTACFAQAVKAGCDAAA